jgi:hypothetical protein
MAEMILFRNVFLLGERFAFLWGWIGANWVPDTKPINKQIQKYVWVWHFVDALRFRLLTFGFPFGLALAFRKIYCIGRTRWVLFVQRQDLQKQNNL